MRSIRNYGCLVLVTAVASGCSTLPDAEMGYYLTKSETKVTVTQTVGCDTKKTRLFIANTVTQATSYVRDPTRPQTFRIKSIDGSLSDVSTTFSFTDDGRLKSVNATSTGQGEAIVKAAVVAATTIAGAAGVGGESPPPACDTIETWGGGKPVTLIYSIPLTYPGATVTSADLKPEEGSKALYSLLREKLPLPKLAVAEPLPIAPSASLIETSGAKPYVLTLGRTQAVDLSVSFKGETIWSATLITPAAQTFSLPVPKAALFGKQSFSLTLSDAGAVTSITYGKESGGGGASNAANAVATALTPDTPAAQATAAKSQADLIAQQQRLVRCQANPTACS